MKTLLSTLGIAIILGLGAIYFQQAGLSALDHPHSSPIDFTSHINIIFASSTSSDVMKGILSAVGGTIISASPELSEVTIIVSEAHSDQDIDQVIAHLRSFREVQSAERERFNKPT